MRGDDAMHVRNAHRRVREGDRYKIKRMGEDSLRRVEILSRAGKATRKYQQAYNVRDLENGNLSWVELKDYQIEEDLEEYCETEEGDFESADMEDEEEETQGVLYMEGDVVSYGIHKKENTNILIKLAKEKKLNCWKDNHVYEEVVEGWDMNIVNTKWIIKEK